MKENNKEYIEVLWLVYESNLLGNKTMMQYSKCFKDARDALEYVSKLKYNIDIEYIEIKFN